MRPRTFFVLMVIFYTLSNLTISQQAHAETNFPPPVALLSLQPQTLNVPPDSSAELIVQLDDSSNVYGISILLDFDPSILSVVDADLSDPGVQISPGNCPQPDFDLFNIVDTGSIHYEVTQLNPTPPCDGGEAATIQFQCLVGNTSTLVTFTESLISTPNGQPIPHTTANAVVNCSGYFNYLPAIFNAPSP